MSSLTAPIIAETVNLDDLPTVTLPDANPDLMQAARDCRMGTPYLYEVESGGHAHLTAVR